MSNHRKPKYTQLWSILRFLISLLALVLILYTGKMAVKFCLGLFMDGYVVTLPGQESPLVSAGSIPKATAPADEESEGPAIELARADLVVTGDLMVHLPIVRSGKSGSEYNFDYIFQYLSSYISKADYAVVNLETTLSGTDGKEYTGYPKFNSPDAIASSAKNAGFDMLLTGNNHCYDYGTAGLKRTLEVVKAAGLATLGTTEGADELKYAVKDVDGVKVGMICYTYGDIGKSNVTLNGLTTDSAASGLINVFDYSKPDQFYAEMENHIAGMRTMGADAIVLFIHWGDEYTTKVNDQQRAIAQKMCDLGVDIIAGSHPHVVQEMALLESTADPNHKTVCLYSMGNFLSNQRATNISLTTGHSEDSLLFSFSLVKYTNGAVTIEDVNLLPTWVLIRGSGDSRKYNILPLDQTVGDWKGTYDLTNSQLEDAKSSYQRTIQIIKPGLDKVNAWINQAEPEPDTPPAFTGGVG